jgi:hypothetical protein
MGSMACCTNRSLYTVDLVEKYGLEYNVSDLPQPDPDLSCLPGTPHSSTGTSAGVQVHLPAATFPGTLVPHFFLSVLCSIPAVIPPETTSAWIRQVRK